MTCRLQSFKIAREIYNAVSAPWKYWWVVAIGVAFSAFGTVIKMSAMYIPDWILWAIALGSIHVAQFLAWNDMRKSRDEVRRERDELRRLSVTQAARRIGRKTRSD